MARRTKIVATLGPASSAPDTLDAVLTAGVDVVRLNLSHGRIDDHCDLAARVRRQAERLGRPVAVLADLPGPKIRCAGFGDRGVHLASGETVRLLPGSNRSDETTVEVDYANLLDDLHAGDVVVIGDGAISLRVDDVGPTSARALIVTGGRATGSPGFHLPSERLRLATPTAEDLVLAERMAEVDVDFLALSFVRGAADIDRVRQVTGRHGPRLVAKVETLPAVQRIEEIVEAADAVMVARGDLGIELAMEEVPHVQKNVIRACVGASVPVITATQMLESMINAPAPTRAEVSDVANAVFDGTDAVMLSGETAIGQHPALVVSTMARIVERAEGDTDFASWGGRLSRVVRAGWVPKVRPSLITQSITHAAWQAAQDAGATAILTSTRSGLTARAMARYRPTSQLIGLSPDERTVRSLALVWGVTPRLVAASTSTDEMVWHAVEAAATAGDVASGDVVVVLARSPVSPDDATDVLRIVRVD